MTVAFGGASTPGKPLSGVRAAVVAPSARPGHRGLLAVICASIREPLRGRDAVRGFAQKFRAAFPDLNFWGTADGG